MAADSDALGFPAFRKQNPIAADEIVPDPQDFDPDVTPETDRDRAAAHRIAQARKLNRLFYQWKADQN